jgi:hypothetical protein
VIYIIILSGSMFFVGYLFGRTKGYNEKVDEIEKEKK